MAFYLADDGTLDTLVTCDTCGATERYNFANDTDGDGGSDAYNAFVEWALEDAADCHDCVGRAWDAQGDLR